MERSTPPSPRCRWLPTLLLGAFFLVGRAGAQPPGAPPAATNPLNADRAYGYLVEICSIGPRVSGTAGMRRQIALVADHFKQLGGEVTGQRFTVRHPETRRRTAMLNLIVRFRPELKRRVLLCCHYDTRPYPDRDRRNPRGTFVGANDGASGVAVLMELAHLMPRLAGDVGVDMVLFDGEELVYVERRDQYFHGSRHFAAQYKNRRRGSAYEWGVLLDMVGDRDLQLYYEQHSWSNRRVRPLIRDLWATAARLGVDEFRPRAKYAVLDDHLQLNQVGIPTCDLIDFDYPYWHTEQDVPQNCSGESLAKVGWVVWEWLRRLDAEGVADSQAQPTGALEPIGASRVEQAGRTQPEPNQPELAQPDLQAQQPAGPTTEAPR